LTVHEVVPVSTAGPPPRVLDIHDLSVEFRGATRVVRAVNGVTLGLGTNETLAVVGESGSGKSVTSLAITRLLPSSATITGGTIHIDGVDVRSLSEDGLRAIRGTKVGMVFQDPLTSLDPVITIGVQMTEGAMAHERISRAAANARAEELLLRVGIPDARRRMRSYPHQLSGGMRQRVMIAAALMLRPRLLVADEPTTALDVTIQAQVLELIREVTSQSQTSVLLVTHDLGVVADMTQRVAVMYAGRIVEQGTTDELFARPRHPYTVGLLRSVARLDRGRVDRLPVIEGSPPDPARLPPGCAFQPRCRWAIGVCATESPPLRQVDGAPGHLAACHHPATDAEATEGVPIETLDAQAAVAP